MAETELTPPCGSKDGLGDMPAFVNPGPLLTPPSGHKDGLGDAIQFPDSSGDVHPVPPC